MQRLKFDDHLIARKKPSGIDVHCELQHFAIVTYAVDPNRLSGLLPERFQLDLVKIDGVHKALLSVVPFVDVDFTSAKWPFPKFTMGQTNYRIYIKDRWTGERCVWFLGTTLDSWTIAVPRYLWNLPWYKGKVSFDCEFDQQTQLYSRYQMHTESEWAPAELVLTQSDNKPFELLGFPDTETALVYLTHPLAGFYHCRNGNLGTYRVWHDRLLVKPATLQSAYFGLLDKIGLVTQNEQQKPHSVLVEQLNEFTIYLPPTVLTS